MFNLIYGMTTNSLESFCIRMSRFWITIEMEFYSHINRNNVKFKKFIRIPDKYE